jgi:uncharacterized protein
MAATTHLPSGLRLAAALDRPSGPLAAYALFAHCFTCGKDNLAASRIGHALADHGIAVLRFDFTGIGASEGEFANAGFQRTSPILSLPPTICGRCTWHRHS